MPSLQEAGLRHARIFTDLLREVNGAYDSGGFNAIEALQDFDQYWLNIKLAYSWAEKNRPTNSIAYRLCSEIPNAGIYILEFRQNPNERIGWLRLGLDVANELDIKDEIINHINCLGIIYCYLQKVRCAIELHEISLVLAKEHSQARTQCAILNNLGIDYQAAGEARKADHYLSQGLVLSKSIDAKKLEAKILLNLGLVNYELGHFNKAIKYDEAALRLFEEFGDIRFEATCLNNLGRIYGDNGNIEQAIILHSKSIKLVDEINDARLKAMCVGNLAVSYLRKGMKEEARKYYLDAHEIFTKNGYRMPLTMKNLEKLLVLPSFLISLTYSMELASLGINSLLGITSNKVMVKVLDPINYARDLEEASAWLYDLGYLIKAIQLAEEALKIYEAQNNYDVRGLQEKLITWKLKNIS